MVKKSEVKKSGNEVKVDEIVRSNYKKYTGGSLNSLFLTFRFGAIDAKLASKHSFPSLNFAAVAGPTHDQHLPFSWDQVPYNRPYFMPINKFYFHPFNQKWVLNSLNSSKFDENIVPQYARINETYWQSRPEIFSRSVEIISAIINTAFMIINMIFAWH